LHQCQACKFAYMTLIGMSQVMMLEACNKACVNESVT